MIFLIRIKSDLLHLKPLKIVLNYPEKAIMSDANRMASSDLLSIQIPKLAYLTVGISKIKKKYYLNIYKEYLDLFFQLHILYHPSVVNLQSI